MGTKHGQKDYQGNRLLQYHFITPKHKKVLSNNNNDVDSIGNTPDVRTPVARGYYTEESKICVTNLKLAPLEKSGFKFDNRGSRLKPQAQRCKFCHQLFAIGESFRDHVLFCTGADP